MPILFVWSVYKYVCIYIYYYLYICFVSCKKALQKFCAAMQVNRLAPANVNLYVKSETRSGSTNRICESRWKFGFTLSISVWGLPSRKSQKLHGVFFPGIGVVRISQNLWGFHDFPRNMKTILSQLLIHKEMSKIPLKFQQWPMFFQKKWLFPKNGIKCLNMFVFFNQCWPPKWLGQKWAPNWGTPIFEQWTFGDPSWGANSSIL